MRKDFSTNIKPHSIFSDILFKTVCVLLFLTMLSIWLVCGMFAKYTANSSNAEGARTASFNITGDGFSQSFGLNITMDPGDTVTKTVTVTNQSEVNVRYTIKMQNTTQNLPVELNDSGIYRDLDNEYTYTGVLASGEESAPVFSLVWRITDTDSNDITDNHDAAYSGMLDNIRVTVTAVQID
jgi:hypothetical protein